MKTKDELIIEKLKEIAIHVGLSGDYEQGVDIPKRLRQNKCTKCDKLVDELAELEADPQPENKVIEDFIEDDNLSMESFKKINQTNEQ
jgi:hypothetical protein